MNNAPNRVLRWFLRVLGAAGLLALPCGLMPGVWMDAAHQWLGLGGLPAEPVVGYLARSTSFFYALLGGLLWTLSCDPARFRPVIRFVGWAIVLLGVLLLWVDLVEGMPGWWTALEGPMNMFFGIAILVLAHRVEANHSG